MSQTARSGHSYFVMCWHAYASVNIHTHTYMCRMHIWSLGAAYASLINLWTCGPPKLQGMAWISWNVWMANLPWPCLTSSCASWSWHGTGRRAWEIQGKLRCQTSRSHSDASRLGNVRAPSKWVVVPLICFDICWFKHSPEEIFFACEQWPSEDVSARLPPQDPFGAKPLWYATGRGTMPGAFAFSSYASALRRLGFSDDDAWWHEHGEECS